MSGNAVIGALRVDLGLETAAWEDGLRKAEGGISTFAASIATGLAAVAAAFTVGVTAAVQRMEQMESASRKVDQVLANTGNAANTSASEIAEWADVLELRTGRAAEEVMGVAANLASYGFGEEIFFRAIELADDMSAAWGGDLRQNLDGLARALENPEKGLAMLSARGITFTAEGRKMAIELAKAGKSAEAAGVLMEELESQVKGAAEQGLTPLARAQARATKGMEDFFEAIARGAGASGIMASGYNLIGASLELVGTHLGTIAKLAVTAGVTIATAFTGQALAAVRTMTIAIGTHMVVAFRALTVAIASNPFGALAVAISGVVTALTMFRDDITIVSGEIATLGDYMRAMWEQASSFAASAMETIRGYMSGVVDAIAAAFGPDVQAFIAGFFNSIPDLAKAGLNIVIGHFVFAVERIKLAWEKLPAALGDVVYTTANRVLSGISTMLNKAGELINSFIGSVNWMLGSISDSLIIDGVVPTDFNLQVQNPYAGGLEDARQGIQDSLAKAYGTDHLGNIAAAMGDVRDRANEIGAARAAIDEAGSSVRAFGELADEALGGSGGSPGGGGGGKGKGKGAGRTGLSKDVQEAGRIFEQTRTPLERYQAQIARLNGLLRLGKIDQDTYNRAVVQAQEEFDRATKKAEGSTNSLSNAASQMGSTFSSAFKGLIDGAKSFSDVLGDVLSQLSDMFINSAFQSLFGNGNSGSKGGGGFLSSIFGGIKLPGFANGGEFKVGGAGGIDSQLVAFRASPSETVSITKPGQERAGGGIADVRVFVDHDGNWQAAVERISGEISGRGLSAYDRQLDRTIGTKLASARGKNRAGTR